MVDLKIDIPDGWLEAEERCGYFVPREMKEVWAVELDLYAEFARVCGENGLRHFASSGTALGAVRHGGFIPWDDDMDVMMLRGDYDDLRSLAAAFEEPYFFQTFETDPAYPYSHAQLRRSDTTAVQEAMLGWRHPFNQGIFLDIFPLDAIPDDERAAERQARRIRRLCWLAYRVLGHTIEWDARSPSARARAGHLLFKPVSRVFDHGSLLAMAVAEQTRYNGDATERLANLTVMPGSPRSVRYRADLEVAVLMDFEFLRVPVPAGYDHALRQLYGDYEVPVAGGSVHGEMRFDADVPYRRWLDNHFADGGVADSRDGGNRIRARRA